MSAKFVEFTNPATNQPILINMDRVLTAQAVPGHNWVQLVMGWGQPEYSVTVEGDYESVLKVLKSPEGIQSF